MRVKWLFCGIIVILLFGGVFLIVHKRGVQKETYINATVVVDGKVLVNRNAKIFGDHVELPLIDILSGIGYSVKWVDTTTAILCNGDRNIRISLEKRQVVDLNNNENILYFPAGKMYFCCYPVCDDLLLDEVTLRTLLFTMGIEVDIHIDAERAEIQINTSI